MIDLDAIEARANAATPPPWRTTGAVLRFAVASATDEDAEFIGHARADIPALCTELTALRARVAELEAALRALTDAHAAHSARMHTNTGADLDRAVARASAALSPTETR